MGLFSFFGGSKGTELLQAMNDYLGKFMVKYASENHDAMPEVAGIFANAQMMVNAMTPKDAVKALNHNGVDPACGALNILQNYAMTEIRPGSTKDILFGEVDEAFNLYMFINDEKLRLGYIDEEQYRDNKRLGNCIRMGQRPLV